MWRRPTWCASAPALDCLVLADEQRLTQILQNPLSGSALVSTLSECVHHINGVSAVTGLDDENRVRNAAAASSDSAASSDPDVIVAEDNPNSLSLITQQLRQLSPVAPTINSLVMPEASFLNRTPSKITHSLAVEATSVSGFFCAGSSRADAEFCIRARSSALNLSHSSPPR